MGSYSTGKEPQTDAHKTDALNSSGSGQAYQVRLRGGTKTMSNEFDSVVTIYSGGIKVFVDYITYGD